MTKRIRRLRCDVLVVGSGVAGLSTALAADPRSVVIATKGRAASGSSPLAQGGIAAARSGDDTPREHAVDTLVAGRGLSDSKAVSFMTSVAASAIDGLEELGVRFDRVPGREGGHSRARVLHVDGDRSGAAIVARLLDRVRDSENVRVEEELFIVDLLMEHGSVAGALGLGPDGTEVLIRASEVVLACGGLGHVFRFTTNPAEVTGDGIALAARAGAELVDLELVQFHPTALAPSSSDASCPLLTEALRGAGARLLDVDGRRFMTTVDPAGDLAPRDIVARAVFRTTASLDLRPIGADLERRFPTVFATCRAHGYDPLVAPIPVTPAAHYVMGGVAVDLDGRTGVPGLSACGETSATGVHGANRLASNSLLEAIAFGHRLGKRLGHAEPKSPGLLPYWRAPGDRMKLGLESRYRLRDVMWEHVGLERNARGLEEAFRVASRMASEIQRLCVSSRRDGELRNLSLVAALLASAALSRRESRGGHFRTDFPETLPGWRRRLRQRLLPGTGPVASRIRVEAAPVLGVATA